MLSNFLASLGGKQYYAAPCYTLFRSFMMIPTDKKCVAFVVNVTCFSTVNNCVTVIVIGACTYS